MSMSARAVVTNSLHPLRREPDDRAEMETQLLFGDTVEILEKRRQWRKVRNLFDGYEGWTDEKGLKEVSSHEVESWDKNPPTYTTGLVSFVALPDGTVQPLVPGSRLPAFDARTRTFRIGDDRYGFEGRTVAGRENLPRLFERAALFLNAPYLWGGMSPFGIDCSGLTQQLFKITGLYRLPRNASQQAEHGRRIDFADRRPGDLAFFADEKGKIHHVGIVWPGNAILHAHGKVRIDDLADEGIYNRETGRLTHHMVLVNRLVE
ncbi:MAG: C40 family peptidase [Chlorobi bacterium]|nr:C40 family peptidase [Chlorobiota bacterium]